VSYKISIASGKGGTGKTTVAANLFYYFFREEKLQVQLIDCDVEEPNVLIFFPEFKKIEQEDIFKLNPAIKHDKCNYCRRCADFCEFNAIAVIPGAKFAEINPGLCHACGACLYACQEDAIYEYREVIGKVTSYNSPQGHSILEGKLKVGSPMQTMLIKKLKQRVSNKVDMLIYDAPPGTSCSVVETISDSDAVILVAEPTLFGLHDFKLMVELIKKLQLPHAVVINKAGMGNKKIYEYIKEENINLLGEVPFLKEYASAYARGNLFNEIPSEIGESFRDMVSNLNKFLVS